MLNAEKRMDIKLLYGLQNEKIVSIGEVDNGLSCNCICPNCKSKLIARHGSQREHHFAHYKSEDCGWRGESVIHKLSKEILSKYKYFKVPKLYWSYKPEIIIYGETIIPIDSIKLEKRIDKIIPDIIIESRGKKLIVEIKVSHGIDYFKYQKIKRLNISTIEIDAREIVTSLFLKKDYYLKSKDFEDALVEGIQKKYWIYNTEKERLKKILKEKHSERLTIKLLKSNSWEFSDLIYVDYCPINKRTWKSGIGEGESYAKLEDDCYRCNYYLGKDWMELKGVKTGISFGKQEAIYCIGHLATKNEYKISGIIYRNQKKIDYDRNESTKHNKL